MDPGRHLAIETPPSPYSWCNLIIIEVGHREVEEKTENEECMGRRRVGLSGGERVSDLEVV